MTSAVQPPHWLRLSLPFCRALHRVAVVWSLVVIILLALAQPLDLLAHRPGGAAFTIAERPVFMVLFAIGVLLAFRWEIVGGSIAAFTASGLVVFAGEQLKQGTAIVIVVAFAVPAVMWIVIDLNDQPRRRALIGLAVAGVAVLAGANVAERIYDDLFGPTHPESNLDPLAESPLDWIWAGAVTEHSFSVVAKVDDPAESLRLVVSEEASLTGARATGSVERGDHGLTRFAIDGLDADTDYFYAVEIDGVPDRVRIGQVRTFPSGPSSFRVAVGSDARVGSNGQVFEAIERVDPLLYLVPGDLHYANIDEPDRGLFEDVLDLTLSRPAPAALYRSTPVAYVWDDHDFGGDGSDPTTPSAPIAQETFRRYVPHYPLEGDDTTIHQAFTVGRVRFILTDGRSARTPASAADDASKTMLGAGQKAWFEEQLLEANGKYPLIVWVSPLPWISEAKDGGDDWGGYSTERRELADFIAANKIEGLLMISGDAHMVAIDDGSNSDYSTSGGAGFPVMHAAALDRPGKVKGGPYSEGTIPGGGQFGVLNVLDEGGNEILVQLSGRDWSGAEILSYEFTVRS